jgi:hypothetical protein
LAVPDPYRPLWQRFEVVARLAETGPDEESFKVTDGNLPTCRGPIERFALCEVASGVSGLAQDPDRGGFDYSQGPDAFRVLEGER